MMMVWLTVSAIASATPLSAGRGAGDDCAQASDRAQVECLSAAIDAARKNLDGLYEAALAKLPENDPSDTRKGKAQLIKAQNAWAEYIRENCAYIGAAEGGSNLWVTNFAARCQLGEIRQRIAFFKHMPDN
jgi:uncharacterized protein YecT (DUF1311 family)